ncbi:unnamed protein product [Cylicocyclus nassatus]|uniref:CHK kinase-like domain-containing protein n=1 Tax=Cylicocyclus nassatus TaxID=53992 RepID=A0AA36H0L5_CYLNA|nr:unnamed protein product [Cylicocyclus nassatus]
MSNLHTRGNGLCGTFVEWDDIERSIQRETNRKVLLGPNKTARQVGDGQGATSCIAIVDPDLQGDAEGLPSRFAVKMASNVGAAQIIKLVGHGLGPDVDVESACLAYDEIAKEGHNREINVYRMFNNCDREISKMPQFYFGTEFSNDNKMKGVIGMELIEDTETLHIFHNVKPDELSDANMKDVLVHGDLWALNLMWTKSKNGLKLKKIIDYQFVHFGCAAEDLARLFITTLSGKDRRENWERLLEEFHSYLMQYCTGELPFTLVQLKESYRRIFPLAGFFLIEVFNFVPKMAGKGMSDAEQKAMKGIILEKTAALLEDMLHFAERKQNLPKNNID